MEKGERNLFTALKSNPARS